MRASACSEFLQQLFPPLPSFAAGLLVGVVGVRRLAGSHEAVARAFVGHGFKGFAGLFHQLDRRGHGRADAGIVSTVEAVNGAMYTSDVGFLVGTCSVEYESVLDILVIRCEPKSLRTSPTNPP